MKKSAKNSPMQLGLVKRSAFLRNCSAEVEAAAVGLGVHEKQAQRIADEVVARLVLRHAGSSIYIGAARSDVDRLAEKVAGVRAQGVPVADIAKRFDLTVSRIYQLIQLHAERTRTGHRTPTNPQEQR